ncbi:MAG: glutamine-hydrolyzing carbamoyl-phosphate synthase small subunit [Candidatus Omnitrophica bacterium]|nr:glutamine-hydrolyzing carbamoyl-phosphate synthase small subunit [Candidatus Omnitrophota bacterium]MBU1868948.1 glutamine-hydrolyzing carbamoyl-phosphate synthase small subunit [Candidatus Omnitrophota bacterium]
MNAVLALEDGTIFKGISFGAEGERQGEVVFNTSMCGYQEIITDPSYKGQIVAMTYPLIGNYGINPEDVESRRIFLEAFIVKEYSKIASNWRSQKSLGDYFKENNILGIEGIDTRKLTLHIRESGAMKAVLSTVDLDEKSLVKKAAGSCGLVGVDLVKEVACNKRFVWSKIKNAKYRVVVVDCGVKYNILRELLGHGCQVVVVPAKTEAKEILKIKPDGLLLSNGPGDPAAVPYVVKTIRLLLEKLPIFGICLGHQMLGQALGGKTYKLKFGHHGANHPVKDLRTGRISITSQNHGFCVDIDSLNKKDIEITHINLNDKTLEGLRHKKLPIFSVQFHPEASPGPHDAAYLFDEFIKLMKDNA